MIYLVSRDQSLFESEKYKHCSFKEALNILDPLELVQFDTETMGLDPFTKALLTIQLGNKDNQVVIDWLTLSSNDRKLLKDYFESDRTFLGWNLLFDLGFLYINNIYPNKIWDGMIADQLIFLGYPEALTTKQYLECIPPGYLPVYDSNGEITHYELRHSLKAAATRWCNIDIDKTVRGKIKTEGLTEEVIVYAAGDVMWLEDIKNKQEIELANQNLNNAMKLECEFVKVLAYTKHCGVHLNIDKWKIKMANDSKRLEKSKKDLNDWTIEYCLSNNVKDFIETNIQLDLFEPFDPTPKCTINWSSQKQVIPLFEKLGIKVDTFDKKTKKKKKSIEEKILAPQANKFPIIPLYLNYQGASKVVSTYGQNWLNAINEVTGRIHPDYHSIGTDTARVSSGGAPYYLNIQNLPHDEETRACFTAEEGNTWLSCDYTGQESCLSASVSGDKIMIDILSSGGDMHSEVARVSWPHILGKLSDKEIKTQHKDLRQSAKNIEFAINYGGDAHTLVTNKGFSEQEANRIYNNVMSRFNGLKAYQDYCRKEFMKVGYILMNPITGHRVHIYDYNFLKRMYDKLKDAEFTQYYKSMKKQYPDCDTVQDVKRYYKQKSSVERQSINYRIRLL